MQFTIKDTGDLKAVSKALRQQADGKEICKQLSKQLRAVAKPLVPKVRAAWLAAPSMGHDSMARGSRGRTDLRALLAKATRVEVRLSGKTAGVRVRTDGRKMPDRMKALPGYAEGIRRRPWRHPVYDNKNVWVPQKPFPRFYAAAKPDEATARKGVEDAVGEVFRQIARAR